MSESPRRLTPNSFSQRSLFKLEFSQRWGFLNYKKNSNGGVNNQSSALTAMVD